jgi:ribosomal protein L11 methyltransferase
VRVPAALAEEARARLLPVAPDGFEEVEGKGWVELAVYGGDRVESALRAEFPDAIAQPVEAGWEDAWRAFHRPVRAGGVWIGPPWEQAPADGVVLVVDPGRAFGTGAHATTRACVELLARVEPGRVLDAGCGSGVLAGVAALLGFEPVHARDHDPVAVAATRETASRNGLVVDARQADVLVDALPEVDLVVANIELAAVEALLARRPASLAITSGYYASDWPSAEGWSAVERVVVEGWAADLLRAPPGESPPGH